MQLVTPLPYDDAINRFGERSPVASLLKSSDWANLPVGLRNRAFWSATVEDTRFLQGMDDFISDFLSGSLDESGHLIAGSRTQFISQFGAYAAIHGLAPLDPADEGIIKDLTSAGRLGLIFDTNVQSAHDYAYWRQGQDPAVLDEFPAQTFLRVQEVKVPRPYHQLNDGRTELKSNLPFWLDMNRDFGVPWGPWGFNSGMGVEDVDRSTAEDAGLIQPGDSVVPVRKDFNDRLQASVENLAPAMITHLLDVFGPQISIENGTASWLGEDAAPEPPMPGDIPAPED